MFPLISTSARRRRGAGAPDPPAPSVLPPTELAPDARLLSLVVAGGADGDEAVRLLVRRHIGFVYASAVRQTRGDAHQAEDVTQAVFILLAQRADTIRLRPSARPGATASLQSWLFVTTRYAAANAIKMQSRRRYHERHAARQRTAERERDARQPVNAAGAGATGGDERDPWPALLPLLDEAVAGLSEPDRTGVLLSFFDNKTFREVGAAMGVSEEAARKRVGRAVEKLRGFFAARGVPVGSAAALCVSLTANAPGAAATTAVPAALVSSVTSVALSVTAAAAITGAGAGAGAGLGAGLGAPYAIAKGVMNMFALAKLKLATATCAACLVVAGGGGAIVASAWAAEQDKPAPVAPAAAAPKAAENPNPTAATFADGAAVEVLGIAQLSGRGEPTWWNADGSPAPEPCDPFSITGDFTPPPSHQLCLRVRGVPEDAGVLWKLSTGGWSGQPAKRDGNELSQTQVLAIHGRDARALDVECHIASGPWDVETRIENVTGAGVQHGDHGAVAYSPAYDLDGSACMTITHDLVECQSRLVAIDTSGVEHPAHPRTSVAVPKFYQATVQFSVPLDQLAAVVVQARPYDKFAMFKGVSLDPANRTKVEIATTRPTKD